MRHSRPAARMSAIVTAAVLLLAGCASEPSDSASSAEPATLEELADAVVAEGDADSAAITEESGDSGIEVQVNLGYAETAEAATVAAFVADLGPRIDAVLGDERPDVTLIRLSLVRDDDEYNGAVTVTDAFPEGDIARAVNLAQSSPCGTIDTEVSAEKESLLTVLCSVTGPEGVADAYGPATELAPGDDVVDEAHSYISAGGVEWSVEVLAVVDGHGELLQSLVTEALSSSVALVEVVDDGESIEISGVIDEAVPAPCDALSALLSDASVSGDIELRLPKGQGAGEGCSATV